MLSESTKRETQWYVINIKARDNQIPQHYVDVFNKLQEEDPLVPLMGDTVASIRDVTSSENVDDDGIPQYMRIRFLVYTIIDKDAFYSIKKDEIISMDWDEDIVANKREIVLIFVPKFHILSFRKSSKISINQVQKYLSEALNKIEENEFTIDIVKSQDEIQRILDADKLISINAKVSFDNGTHTDDFRKAFEDKAKQSKAEYIEIELRGTKEHPLDKSKDSLVETLIKISEMNGMVVAKIQADLDSKVEIINTESCPKILKLPPAKQIFIEVCKEIKKLVGSKL